jgi:6-phosphogluconate dehydrogenase
VKHADIGLIGLGVMGANLALNIAEKGYRIAVFNRTWTTTEEFIDQAGSLREQVTPCQTIAELAATIAPPRPVIILVKAGDPVDQQIAALRSVLSANDIIIDAGNANFRDTIRRDAELKDSGLAFIGMGISGGEEGARHGPSIMAGGPRESYERVEKILTAIAAKYRKQPCAAWLGPDGAGHFVKTIHNGIEYADMQMIAEVYGIMRDGLGMKPADMAQVFTGWNSGKLNSYLVEITGKVLGTIDPATGKPLVDMIVDSAGQKGTGKWSAIEAQQLAVPATAIEAAVAARVLSSMREERAAAEKAYGIARKRLRPSSRTAYLRKLESALYAAKIAAYAQGFAVLERASADFGWQTPLGTVASIWRAGCIIRSQFLDLITKAYVRNRGSGNLLLDRSFVKLMKENHAALRGVVADAAAAGMPVPALSSALAHFDSYRQSRGTANLIQGQRDFFGAHSFERLDAPGAHHGPWSGTD